MPLLASTGLRNKILETGSLKSILANGFIHVYYSTLANIPLSADDPIETAKHQKLLTVYGDGISSGLNLGTAANGAINKSPGETWAGPVLNTGNAVFFRFVGSADTGFASTTEARLQGRVGVSGAELNISSLALVAGNTQAVNFASISLPG
jgi:hypothetical protein